MSKNINFHPKSLISVRPVEYMMIPLQNLISWKPAINVPTDFKSSFGFPVYDLRNLNFTKDEIWLYKIFDYVIRIMDAFVS